MTAILVGFDLGECEEEGCENNASTQIRGKNYCPDCGEKHIPEAVEDGLAQAIKRHSG